MGPPKRSLLLGLAVGSMFLFLTFSRLEWDSVQTAVTSAMPGPLLLGFVLLAASLLTRITRWWWMLRAVVPELPLCSCVRPFLVSLAVNNTVPLRAGDLFRTVGFRDELRSPPMLVFGTLFVERLLDFLVLLTFFFIGLIILAADKLPLALVKASIGSAAVCMLCLLTLLLIPNRFQQAFRRVVNRRWLAKHNWSVRIETWIVQLFNSLSLLRSPKLSLQLAVMSIIAWTFEGGMFAAVAWSLRTDHVAPLGPWFSMATGTLATILPSSPGYVGTFDYFAMLGLVAAGANREIAVVFALLVHLFLWVPVTLVGMLYLTTQGRRIFWRGR